MSKSKKAKKADQQESPAKVEGQEVSNSEEQVPATIVESGMEEVFPSQTEEQSDPKDAGIENTTETPAPKPRVSKRPYIALVESHLETGDLDKKGLLALIMEQFPTVNRNGASTFLTDALNPRYSHWKDRIVSKTADGKLVFADKLQTPGPEVVPEAEPAEKQAE